VLIFPLKHVLGIVTVNIIRTSLAALGEGLRGSENERNKRKIGQWRNDLC